MPPRLLLVNGAPGVGKSTLAQRYADAHPLALVVDIDGLRTQLGQWADREETRLVARELAIVLIDAHLRAGHDVVVAQYLGRPEFRVRLADLAEAIGASFVEVLLTDDPARVVERFRTRRADNVARGFRHPEGDLADDAIDGEVRRSHDALLADATARRIPIVSAADGPDRAYEQLMGVVAD